jgi:hypothetical protein
MIRRECMRNRSAKPSSGTLCHSRGNGQATVEFALIFLVVLAMIYGIIEFSRVMLINAEVENSAREAARYLAQHPGADSNYLRNNVIASKLVLIDRNSPNFFISEPCFLKAASCSDRAGVGPYYPVEVTVIYTWTSAINFVPDLNRGTLGPLGPIILKSKSIRMIEGR